MPQYDFSCSSCQDNEGNKAIFTISVSMKDYKGEAECPECNEVSKTRVYDIPAVTAGRTAAEKKAGTTKQRFEIGRRIKDDRAKIKKESDPNSRAAISNEYWVGGASDNKLLGK